MISFLKNHIFFYIGYLVGVSLVAFFAYVIDKGKAKRGAWRIPEKVLLTLSLIGGATGGYVAMNLVRHKTQKWNFHVVNVLGLAWQGCLLVFLLTA